MKRLITQFWHAKDIPYGVRIITLVTAIRWFGWGFAESLMPVFLYSFGGTFANAGLLRSGYDLMLILSLPFIGMIADRMRASTLILVGLFMYFFIGASYLFAGITGFALFIVVARMLNGVAFGLDSVGRQAYFRRYTPTTKVATAFGYFDTVANLAWITAALIGILLLQFFSISSLLFLITPTAMIAFVIVWQFRQQEAIPVAATQPKEKYGALLRELGSWNWSLKSLVVFNFFIASASSVVLFFLPIEAYNEGASLSLIVLFGIVSTMPMLFGWLFGRFFDKKGSRVFTWGLALLGVLLFTIPFFDGYLWKLIVAFIIGIILELLSVGSNELITVHSNPEHFGRVDGIMRSIANIGSMTGPLIVGIMLDSYGIQSSYVTLAIIIATLAIAFHFLRKRGYMGRAPSSTEATPLEDIIL